MKIVFQSGIDKPTQELNAQMLQQMTENPATSALIDNYREMKRRMAEAQARHEVDKFVKTVVESDDYQRWLATELKKDKPRTKKRIPADDVKRVELYITQQKTGLPATIPTACFTESTNRWGHVGMWRVQKNSYLTGLAVLDADHVTRPEERVEQWLQRDDFQQLGIVWIFITPSGEGIKVVFKAREDWGNLQDNAYQMAGILGVRD